MSDNSGGQLGVPPDIGMNECSDNGGQLGVPSDIARNECSDNNDVIVSEVRNINQEVVDNQEAYRKEDSGPFQIMLESLNSEKNGISRIHPMSLGKLITVNHPEISKNIISIRKLGRNRIKIELNNAISANKLMGSVILKEKGFKSYIPRYLLHRKGIIRGVDVGLSDDEIREAIRFPYGASFEIIEIKRMKRRAADSEKGEVKYVPTQSVMITFRGQSLPQCAYIHYVCCEIRKYIQNVIQCKKCLRYGHYKDQCKGQIRCEKCGDFHETEHCNSIVRKCVNCGSTLHLATNHDLCPRFKKEKTIKQVMADSNISYMEARNFLDNNSFAAIADSNTVPNFGDFQSFPSLNNNSEVSRVSASSVTYKRPAKRQRVQSPPQNVTVGKELLFPNVLNKNIPGGLIQNNPYRAGGVGSSSGSNRSQLNSTIVYDTVLAVLTSMDISSTTSWDAEQIKSLITKTINNLSGNISQS